MERLHSWINYGRKTLQSENTNKKYSSGFYVATQQCKPPTSGSNKIYHYGFLLDPNRWLWWSTLPRFLPQDAGVWSGAVYDCWGQSGRTRRTYRPLIWQKTFWLSCLLYRLPNPLLSRWTGSICLFRVFNAPERTGACIVNQGFFLFSIRFRCGGDILEYR